MTKTFLVDQIYFLFLLAAVLAFLVATIVLSFHWGRYGRDVRAIKLARPVYYLGSLAALGAMIWSYFQII